MIIVLLSLISVVLCGPATESYKDQYCTDPRTMRKHAAYTEWADAYSCSRHRCQPGGRNLAIYTVGCKRVEAPESAIECEEVVEDTNMQFPYCCTRLRCLVVVRGEVWTRVLGQPWETLPAAPWSHMYKMKRPPPADGSFLPKNVESGPVYELSDSETREKMLRTGMTTEKPDCNEHLPRSAPVPDIVIALSTNSEQKEEPVKKEKTRSKRFRKTTPSSILFDEHDADAALEMEEPSTDKPMAPEGSDERFYANDYGVTQKIPFKTQLHQVAEIPQNQWNEKDLGTETDANKDSTFHQPNFHAAEPQPNLQTLVDAIGTRMRDIESVVQKMSDKVQDVPLDNANSAEKRSNLGGVSFKHHNTEKDYGLDGDSYKQMKNEKDYGLDGDSYKQMKTEKDYGLDGDSYKQMKTEKDYGLDGDSYKQMKTEKDYGLDGDSYKQLKTEKDKPKVPYPDAEHYKRFSVRNRSKYLHTPNEGTTELPLFSEDTNMNGYFSDASNSVLRRSNGPKEPAQTYMAPVENRRKSHDSADDTEKKHKKRTHKKRKNKHGHKKHRGKDEEEKKKKRFNRISSEIEKNVVSLEDSAAVSN